MPPQGFGEPLLSAAGAGFGFAAVLRFFEVEGRGVRGVLPAAVAAAPWAADGPSGVTSVADGVASGSEGFASVAGDGDDVFERDEVFAFGFAVAGVLAAPSGVAALEDAAEAVFGFRGSAFVLPLLADVEVGEPEVGAAEVGAVAERRPPASPGFGAPSVSGLPDTAPACAGLGFAAARFLLAVAFVRAVLVARGAAAPVLEPPARGAGAGAAGVVAVASLVSSS
jgi:hypothetical protein